MRKGVKVLAWVAVFAACAGVGAFIAAHTTPFPPNVPDPGARPTASPTSPPPAKTRIKMNVQLDTSHVLYVGGACHTNWHGLLIVDVTEPGGAAGGTGILTLQGGLHCDFPVKQVQAKAVTLAAKGTFKGGRLVLALRQTGLDPVGSADFGGLTQAAAFIKIDMPIEGGTGSQQIHLSRSDGDRGSYTVDGNVDAVCVNGC
jgi:hypothetical protein